uniref:Uncharacterized protein n=1 Tax=Oryza sativa subsp. japonica TaxID=39947 RepID=Q7XZX8_ORYSJ|nr:hypothetical protein [Oryza sativa Japonica Group]
MHAHTISASDALCRGGFRGRKGRGQRPEAAAYTAAKSKREGGGLGGDPIGQGWHWQSDKLPTAAAPKMEKAAPTPATLRRSQRTTAQKAPSPAHAATTPASPLACHRSARRGREGGRREKEPAMREKGQEGGGERKRDVRERQGP